MKDVGEVGGRFNVDVGMIRPVARGLFADLMEKKTFISLIGPYALR